jgi:GTP-binding protein LepA
MATGAVYEVEQVGVFTPKSRSPRRARRRRGRLRHRRHQGRARRRSATRSPTPKPPAEPLPGFKEVKPMVFAGSTRSRPTSTRSCATRSRSCKLNDASLHYEPETSQALGFGFRCGFLGLLHMEIVQERLEREFDLDLITTAPTVVYQVLLRDGTVIEVDNPAKMPDPAKIEEIREPIVTATILVPQEYVGAVMTLCQEKRGVQRHEYLGGRAVHADLRAAAGEIVLDFFDR